MDIVLYIFTPSSARCHRHRRGGIEWSAGRGPRRAVLRGAKERRVYELLL